MADNTYLTPAQAAELLHLGVSTIRGYIRSGKIKASKVGGGRKWLIERTEITRLVEDEHEQN